MKKIDAYWELRNLNKKTLEIEFEQSDSLDCLKILKEEYSKYEYIVAKVPRHHLDIVHNIEMDGFSFIEMQLEMEFNLIKLKKVYASSKKIQFKPVENVDDLEEMISKIDVDLFVTDRISLDSAFGIHYAHKRYINWIRDEFISGNAEFYEAIKNNEKIGFSFFKKNSEKTIDAILVSVYKPYRRKGIGLTFLIELQLLYAEKGYTKISTRVSSNNLEAIRAYLSTGSVIKEISYILRKLMV